MTKIVITLSTGRKVTLKHPDELGSCDRSKEISLVFNNGEIYSGWVVGFDEEDDENNIVLKRLNTKHSIGLPYDRLVGWYYE